MIAVAALALLSSSKFLAGPEHHQAHDPHPLAASLATEFGVIGDHDHASPDCFWDQAANLSVPAVMRGEESALLAIGVIAAVFAGIAFAGFKRSGVRGPPRSSSAISSTGREVLTRLCIARR
ncbi:hypothetical protein DQP55_21935 [Mycolicibacterium sp. GF69]|nr:hypothetical protein DQP55_21935 [Mycolicibacterium sp. GF69]